MAVMALRVLLFLWYDLTARLLLVPFFINASIFFG